MSFFFSVALRAQLRERIIDRVAELKLKDFEAAAQRGRMVTADRRGVISVAQLSSQAINGTLSQPGPVPGAL